MRLGKPSRKSAKRCRSHKPIVGIPKSLSRSRTMKPNMNGQVVSSAEVTPENCGTFSPVPIFPIPELVVTDSRTNSEDDHRSKSSSSGALTPFKIEDANMVGLDDKKKPYMLKKKSEEIKLDADGDNETFYN